MLIFLFAGYHFRSFYVFTNISTTIYLRSHGLLYFLWIVVPKTFLVITEHTFQEKREEENKKNLDADDDLYCKGQKYISVYNA